MLRAARIVLRAAHRRVQRRHGRAMRRHRRRGPLRSLQCARVRVIEQKPFGGRASRARVRGAWACRRAGMRGAGCATHGAWHTLMGDACGLIAGLAQ